MHCNSYSPRCTRRWRISGRWEGSRLWQDSETARYFETSSWDGYDEFLFFCFRLHFGDKDRFIWIHRFTRDLSQEFGMFQVQEIPFFLNRSESRQFEGLKFPFQFLESSTSKNASGTTCASHRLSHQFHPVSRNVHNTQLGLSGRMRARRGVSCIVLLDAQVKYMEFDSKLVAKVKNQTQEMSHLTYNTGIALWIIPTCKDLSFGTMIDRLLVYAPAISADPMQQESLKELRQG